MFISHTGVLFEDTNDNGAFKVTLSAEVSVDASLNSALGKFVSLSAEVDVEADLTLKGESNLTLNAQVDVEAQCTGYIPRTVPETAKYSSYTIIPAIRTHTEYAVDNLISQFKEYENIEKLLEGVLLELDKAQTDIYDFQSEILNLEEAEGDNLDICGSIVGRDRITDQGDLTYRNQIYAQIYANICDGSLPKILSALIINYNLEPDETSKPIVQVDTLPRNRVAVYLRDVDYVNVYGGNEFVQSLVPAGALAQIVVNEHDTEVGNYFSLSSVDGTDEEYGAGLSSVDASDDGGELVGIYNHEDFTDYSGYETSNPLPITTKVIPVQTFTRLYDVIIDVEASLEYTVS